MGKVIRQTNSAVSAASTTSATTATSQIDPNIYYVAPSTFVVSLVGYSGSTVTAASSTVTPVLNRTSRASLVETDVTATDGPNNRRNSLAFGLGAGLGVPLGLASVGFLTFMMWTARRQRLEQRKSMSTDVQYTEGQVQEQSRQEENINRMPRELERSEREDEISTLETREHYELDV